MKHFILNTTILSGLVVFGSAAFAQDHQDEERYHQMNRDEGWWRGHLFQRVREDLDHIQASTPAISGDEFRLATTKQELNELQGKLEAHRYDQPELDRVIGGIEKVLTNNHMSARDRDLLSDDLRRMRDFREHHEGYESKG